MCGKTDHLRIERWRVFPTSQVWQEWLNIDTNSKLQAVGPLFLGAGKLPLEVF